MSAQPYAVLLERLRGLIPISSLTGHSDFGLVNPDGPEAAEAISSLLKRVGELEGLLREADEIAWPEAAILALHRDKARQNLAKAALYGWRDRVRAALNSDASTQAGGE